MARYNPNLRKPANTSAGGNPVTKTQAQTFSFPKAMTGRSNLQTGHTSALSLKPSSLVFFGGGAQETASRGPAFLPRRLHGFRGPTAPEGYTTGGGTSSVGSGGGAGGGGGASGSGGGGGFQPVGPHTPFVA